MNTPRMDGSSDGGHSTTADERTTQIPDGSASGSPLVSRLRYFVEARPVLARLVENASWLMLERMVLLALGFVFNAWVVRYLGPTEYGRYSYALSFCAIASSFAALGMDSVVVREIARAPSTAGEILGTALVLRCFAGLVAWLSACAVIVPLRHDAPTRELVFVLGLNAVVMATGIFELWFQARIAARGLVVTRVAITVVTQLSRAALILAQCSVLAFAVLYVLSGALTSLAVYLLFARSAGAAIRLRWNSEWAQTMMREAWPMVVIAIGIAIYMKVDQVMLAAYAGDRQNGMYAPAAALSELWYFVPVAISASVFPVIVKALDTLEPGDVERRLQAFYDAMATIGYAVALPTLLVADEIVAVLYGPEYADSGKVLRVHILSLAFVCVGIARGRYLIAKKLYSFTLLATLGGAVLNVILNAVWLPKYGAMGAAWATVLAYALANYLSGFLWRPMWRQTGMITRALLGPLRLVRRVYVKARVPSVPSRNVG
jgi:polysaccharide transporter, PST family